jgi:hypothetical protein
MGIGDFLARRLPGGAANLANAERCANRPTGSGSAQRQLSLILRAMAFKVQRSHEKARKAGKAEGF